MKVITSVNAATVATPESRGAAGAGWLALLILAATGSVVCLISGLGISLLTASGMIAASPSIAHITIALLLGFFILFFVAAHSMDRFAARNKEIRVEKCRRTGLADSFKTN